MKTPASPSSGSHASPPSGVRRSLSHSDSQMTDGSVTSSGGAVSSSQKSTQRPRSGTSELTERYPPSTFESRSQGAADAAPSVISRLGGAILGSAATVAAAAVGVAAGGASEMARLATGTLLPTSSPAHSRTVSTTQLAPPPPRALAGGLAARRYRTTTIIKDGILEKWTNYVGAWRPRYFVVEPGILKYANAPGQPIKETFPLVLCSTRLCPGDPLRLELEHPHGVLYLRLPSPEEKRLWIDALLNARNTFQQQQHQQQLMKSRRRTDSVLPPPPPPDGSTNQPTPKSNDVERNVLENAALSDSDDEKSPMIALMENCAACRQSLQSAANDLRKLQSLMLRLAGQVKDPQFRDDFKNLSLRLVEAIDYFQVATNRHLLASETLAADEHQQRRALQHHIRTLAKRNYRMRSRLQRVQRLLLNESELERQQEMRPETSDGLPTARWSCEQMKTDGGGGGVFPTSSALSSASVTPPASVAASHVSRAKHASAGGVPDAISVEHLPDVLSKEHSRTTETGAQSPTKTLAVQRIKLATLLVEGFSDDEGPTSSESLEEGSEHKLTVDHEDDEDLGEFYDAEEEGHADVSYEPVKAVPDARGIVRRTELPKPRTEFKVSLWSILKDCIGKDLSRISVPVYFNEPTSFLQRLAEDFQYVSLLKESVKHPYSPERLLYVTLFSISPYASTVGRTYKPFNPLLGETFEFSHRGFRFLAEQVGHHPPVTAYYAAADEFQAWGHLIVNNRFTGKSLEVSLPGSVNIVLHRPKKTARDNHSTFEEEQPLDHYTYQRSKAIVNNVIFGKLSFEMFGTVLITNHTTGWWSRELHVVRGLIFDSEGFPRYRIGGWWSRELWVEEIDVGEHACRQPPASTVDPPSYNPTLPFEAEPVPEGIEHFADSILQGKPVGPPKYFARNPMDIRIKWDELQTFPGSRRVLWRPEPRPPNSARFYEFGQMTMELNDLSSDYDISQGASMPPTDSRYRPDQRLLESGETELANMEKNRLEEKQRANARARGGGEADYHPRWFYRGMDPVTNQVTWNFSGEYWEAKKANHFKGCSDIF